ncbi:metallophosphoesterase [Prolixibacteraceae bacterium Z1-6]|uniref:Metallophosphoesterase n=1 Tax=Draconibacterium aestuarii TaxID=2998507 RepID=A0A9X3J5N9_9BACT|nr:metallophosphoesterase [Prolixibacteraceae bacterium Z1-6]
MKSISGRVVQVLVLVLLVGGNVFAQDTLSFLHISDTHLIFNLECFQEDLAENRKGYKNGVEPLKKFLATMPQKTGSDWVVATGDLIDFYEGENKKGEMMDFQLEQLIRLTEICRVPCFFTLGNHDIISYFWGDGQRISHQSQSVKAEAAWTRNAACFKDGTYYSKVYDVDETTYRLLFLNDSYYDFSDEENIPLPYVDKIQLHWLEAQLAKSDEDVEIIFMHIPFHEEMMTSDNLPELFSVLKKYPSVKLMMAGHNHKNMIRSYPVENGNELIQVKTGAFASGSESWRQIKLTRDKILISKPGSTENEKVIPF